MQSGRAPDATQSWWEVQGHWVEAVNQRRGGSSGMQCVEDPQSGVRYYVKRQINHLYRDLQFPTGRPTLLREWLNLKRCEKLGIPTPQPVFFDMRKGASGWEAILVTRGLDNYISLEQGLKSRQWNDAQWHDILHALAETLARLHQARRKHGHLYPKEVFVRAGAEVSIALLDWEMGRYTGRRHWAARSDLGRLWRSLISDGGIPEADRQQFMQHYQSLTGLRGLRLRGLDDG